jgi:hypothetical protein
VYFQNERLIGDKIMNNNNELTKDEYLMLKKLKLEQELKSPGLAAAFSIIPGVGYLYCGSILKGILFICALFLFWIIVGCLLSFASVLMNLNLFAVGVIIITSILVFFIIWIWSIVDCKESAEEKNEIILRENGLV